MCFLLSKAENKGDNLDKVCKNFCISSESQSTLQIWGSKIVQYLEVTERILPDSPQVAGGF